MVSEKASNVLSEENVYRKLQEHLDQLPVGYPPTESGVEIRILKHLFTPEEAKIATMLKFAWKDFEPLENIHERVKTLGYSIEELEAHLDNMAKKGAIIALKEGDKKTYSIVMFVIGFFEFQVNKLTKEFIEDFYLYLDEAFILDTAKIPISQLRFIPVGITPEQELGVASYDDIKKLIENIEGPFIIINCICRQAKDILGEPCKATSRREICMGIGHNTKAFIDLGWGRQISKKEAIENLQKSQEEGLIFQIGNAQKPEMICSCCTCCCEALTRLKSLPTPADFITSNYYAQVEPDLCKGCETCINRCQMDAISLEDNISVINRKRCIGCGNCVIVCPSEAIKLHKKEKLHIPPMTHVDLYKEIMEVRTKIKEKELRKKLRREKRIKK